ncbi:hypothetical protein R1sor_002974 [Riccia sorocarpa]|uniref:ribonuclease H n=1 Tax=Riccia sorocarpa TaxID=122646 RepID=A0ABD3H3D5_9MARC
MVVVSKIGRVGTGASRQTVAWAARELSMADDENYRVYNPNQGNAVYSCSPQEVMYDQRAELTYLRYRWVYDRRRKLRTDRGELVVAIDGACRGNGTPNATAAYGVYFGHGSCYNRCGLLPWNERHTSQNAEIYAAQIAFDFITENFSCKGITIITDSSYLVKAMTEYIYKWVRNGFISSGTNRRIVNAGALENLHETIVDMEVEGVDVRFWHVRREDNEDADALANAAF